MKKPVLFFLFITSLYFSLWAQPASPILIEPPTNSTQVSVTPLLKWSEVTGATNYKIEIATDSNFISLIATNLPLVSDTQYLITTGTLISNTTYYWRVAALDGSIEGPFSTVFNFRTIGTSQQEIGHLEDYIRSLINSNELTQIQGNLLINRLEAAKTQIELNHKYFAILNMLLFKLRVCILTNSDILSTFEGEYLQHNADGIINLINTGNSIVPPVVSFNKSHQFDLKQNYPNPFNPSTNIEYTVPEQARITLKIYDILGKEVVTLVDKVQEAGTYIAIWNASNFSSGIYFYRLNDGKNITTKRMTLTK